MKNAIKGLFHREQPELLYSGLIAKINSIELGSSDAAQLKAIIDEYRKNTSPEKDDFSLLLAAVKEVIYRVTGLRLFNSQLAASISLLDGHVAQLPTGEGKTLAAVAAASIMAIESHCVHVLVFNDYLAKRDFLFSQPIYAFFGLSSGTIQESTPAKERKNQYGSNILYVAAKEAGFDLLRDFLSRSEEELLEFPQDCAIVDEADSILIDEAKIPLVLAGSAPEEPFSVNTIAQAVKGLTDREVSVNLPAKQVYLTDEGIRHVEAMLSVDNLYAENNSNTLAEVNAALQANYLLCPDCDYLVKGNSVLVIDEFTGRVAVNRKFPDLLQAAVEAKEHLTPSRGSMVYNTMTIRDFLRRYDRLSGMTGTARDSAEEFDALYGLPVDVIPPNKPCCRIDRESLVFRTYDEKMQAAVEEINRAHSTGEPILIGTQSVEESELLSAMLQRAGIIHSVLNAKNDEEEAELIGKAGELFRVTVSTNMAGRGVDIKLGGRKEQDREKVLETGGLYVIGTGINRSTRIDNQLRGRAGRQGDVGRSRFFLSLEDPLLKPYHLKPPQNQESAPLIGDRHILNAVKRIQRYAEGEDAEARYMLSKYTYIQEQQRKLISDLRRAVLAGSTHLCTLGRSNPEIFGRLVEKAGTSGVAKAEQQLSLYFINFCWARFLESMENARDGIHLMLIGSKNPIDEYHRIAITAFDEMMRDISEQVDRCMVKFQITADGIDLKQNGLSGATTTWTYMIDESSSQFSRIPYLMKTVSNRIKGAVFTVQDLFRRS
jgi:preprotein translocase subunit SecA